MRKYLLHVLIISFVFPFKWVLIGLLGVTLDIVKAPGFIWGGMLGIMGKSINKTT